MKLHQLRYLAAVAQTGLNITAAAEKLHTSQPGVSQHIKQLEDEIKRKADPQLTVKLVELSQTKERLRQLEEASRADQKL